MHRFLPPSLLLLLILTTNSLQAQQSEPALADSVKKLDEITVHAFEYDKPLNKVPAAIGIINTKDLSRYSTASILPAINSIPGVRMEERSPGSYRFSIRGSTLRSPFGVRNVKFYWNDLPFTDAGGNTYLNLIDLNMIGQVEVLKGPGSSLYGAGTGGVVMLKAKTADFNSRSLTIGQSYGSFGLVKLNASLETSTENASGVVQFAHQQADGYRQHSAMKRDVLFVNEKFNINTKRAISLNLLYADLSYETPGALTKAEYDQDGKLARPTVKTTLGAVDQKAAIYNKTVYMGLVHEYEITKHWSNRTGAYGSFTKFENPTVRATEYERKTEQNIGLRSITQYKAEKLKFNFGGEYQYGFTPSRTYQNIKGTPGTLQTDTETTIQTGFLFAQADVTLPGEFLLTAGASYNLGKYKFTNLIAMPVTNETRNFSSVVTPRIALLKSIIPSTAVYASYSMGFSPPVKDELYPSNKVFNKTLNPEEGNNYEAGVKGSLLHETIRYTVTGYSFQLSKTIVTRIANDGADYYVNQGAASQKGIEATLAWAPVFSSTSHVKNFGIWGSYALNKYAFKNYFSKDTADYSGNKITGAPTNMVTIGLDLTLANGLYANVTVNHSGKIALNDANTAFTNAYTLLGGRIGLRSKLAKHAFDVFTGVDNALSAKYSLGNDLNAFGGRYYNAAPTINFYAGLSLKLGFSKS